MLTTGYCFFYYWLCNIYKEALIAWKSKQQDTTALSSTEAEYMVFTEVIMMVKGIKQILVFIGRRHKSPTRIYVDNTGAIFFI